MPAPDRLSIKLFSRTLATLLLAGAMPWASGGVLISEIMFHPASVPEPLNQEWIELQNPDAVAVNVSGWQFTKGITYTIPNGIIIPAGGYLVVAADPVVFAAAHPGFAGVVVGGWTGRLSNSGEQIQLDDALGAKVNDVTYADEGEWALRTRGELSFSHRGWDWICDADGTGKTFELRNATLGNGSGQNWRVSMAAGGTPGAVNSVVSTNVAPLIKDAKHRPEIPKSTEPIVVSAEIEDEFSATATLHWRLDGAPGFDTVAMTDADGDGDVEATILAQANLAIVEWYISATDGVNTRTWPAPARTSNPGVVPETFGQVTNALLQVDDAFDAATNFTVAGNQPIYRLIMTEAERAELALIGSTNGQEDSVARMNGTFISHDGTGVETIYLCGFRNRGFASALGPPNNFSLGFRSDARWSDRTSFQLNCQYGYSQVLGNSVFSLAGIAPQDAAPVRARINGVDLAESGARMYGRYARLEGRNSEWAERHFPNDSDGNFYRLDDHAYPQNDPRSGEFGWEGPLASSYSDTFFKETNQDENDYSDLIEFARVVSAPAAGGTVEQPAIPDSAYVAAVSARLDLDQFYRYLAVDALIGNREGGLQSGRADDTSIYRGLVDPRFRFIPHDLDDVFAIGNGVGNSVTRSIFSYDGQAPTSGATGVVGFARLLNHPQLAPRYYTAVLEGLNSWFTHAALDPLIDQLLAGWVPASNGASTQNNSIAEIKAFIDARRANVLGQIQQNYSLTVTTSGTDVDGNKRTNDGSATIGGTFNVARTYSITVNGQLAQWSYRGASAGTWSLAVPVGGGTVLSPGLNNIVVKFWDGINGTGNVVQQLTSFVLWQPATPAYTNVSGTLAPAGSLAVTAPASYIPGIPFLVKVDLKNAAGDLDRTAWNRTATLSATGGVTLNPSTVQLTNGMGSALVTVGGGGGGGSVTYLTYGTGGTGTAATVSGTPGSTWRVKHDYTTATIGSHPATWANEGFDDSAWITRPGQTGYGNADENQTFTRVDYDAGTTGTQNVPSYFFRSTFTIADISQLASVTGQIKYDDAYRIFINGVKVLNSTNLPDTTPITAYSGNGPGDNTTANITIPLVNLHNGVNTIAVEIHQGTAASSDVTFDLRLQGNLIATDPGNFTLTAAVGGLNNGKALTSLTGTPTMTNVSGVLPAGTTNWSGVINVTGNVTVPAGATLNIAPGTHVLIAGTPDVDSESGTDLIVNNTATVNAIGTFAQPISITSAATSTRWGEINTGGAATTWRYCLVSHSGHGDDGGHTDTGPCFRLSDGAVWTFEDGAITDLPGKTLTNSGNTTIAMRRSHFARCVMGPETDDSNTTIEDCNFTEMLPVYRESGGPDDEDNIYIHNPDDRPVILRRSVFSNSGDDGIDLLAGTVTVEDCIVRNIFDKGMSLLQNDVTVRRTQIIDCDFCISAKTQIDDEATLYTLTMENCTLVGEVHPTNQGDQSGGVFWHSVGVHVRNKYGTGPNAQLAVVAKNCVISAVTPMLNDYAVAGTDFPLLTSTYNCYQDVAGTNPVDPAVPAGTGDIAAVPLFVDAAAKDFHLQPTSPARDTGDPASPLDGDGSRADMGALPFGTMTVGGGSLVWTPAGGPYRVTAATTIPANLTLTIQAGTAVYFDQNARLTVNGNLQALGTPDRRITFSHVPGTVAAGDCDPIKLGTQTGPPKWGGIRLFDSMAAENTFKYCDFINAQGTDPATSENFGSLGFIRSWGFCEGLTFAGTHLRMLYGRNCKLTVFRCVFPTMFIFDPVLGRIEEPTTDFIASADNRMEPLKVEFPTTDPEVLGVNAANFPNGLPLNGHWRVYYNEFNGNRGHQDVFDADSGRWAPRDASGNQTNGQFMLDCRYNHFFGLAGDEHIDLGGDAYIASNIFENAKKDFWTNDTGYSNAISSGDKGTGTTIMVARNVCYDLDHVINLKASTATIFEHNTVANLHADFQFVGETVTQNVVCAPVNFFIPGDGGAPTNGDGAYLGFNLVSNVPHVFSGPDASSGGPVTTKIEFFHNLLDQIADPVIGPNHPGGYFSGTYGPNESGAPDFINTAAENYGLKSGSLAMGRAPGGIDYGATIAEWAYVLGGPSGTVNETTASFTVGGPGIVAYKWRLDGGAWSVPVQIGDGGLLPRVTPTARQSTLALNNLTTGAHTLEVLGQDMAGNWQDADPARTIIGAAQVAPTVRTWTVDPAASLVLLNEVLADSATLPDTVELHNRGTSNVNLGGWSLTDDPLLPTKYSIPAGTTILAGNYLTFTTAQTGIALDKDADAIYLYQGGVLKDSIAFGHQIAGLTLGRTGTHGTWSLCTPTLGAANIAQRTGDLSTIRINEWFSDGDVLYDNDWVELVNTGALPVDLGGMRMTDNRAGDASNTVLPPYSFIAGGGYIKITNEGLLGFSLDAQQESITLFDASGALLDTVVFYPQTTDYSMVRNGSGYGFRELPTGGFEIADNDPAYLNALAILRGLRITEIMFNAIGGNDYEYVELRNVGAIAFDLNGVKFVNGIDFTFGPLTLGAGQNVLVVKHAARFAARYGTGPLVAGAYGGNLDNSGEGLALQLPPPFDANLLTFSFSDMWYLSTDGLGTALVVVDPLTAARDWDERETWTATGLGGNPGGAGPRSDTYSGWSALHGAVTVTSDGDLDGVPALVEFGLGMDPTSPNGGDGRAGSPLPVPGANGGGALTFLVPQNALAGQGHGLAEATYRVQASSDLTNWTTIATKTLAGSWSGIGTTTFGTASGGFQPVTVEDTVALGSQPRRLLRLQLTWVP